MSNLPTPYTIQGARIEAARTAKELSQTDLALALRQWLTANAFKPNDDPRYRERVLSTASQSTVSRYERGQRLPKGPLLGALSAVLDLDPRYILALPEATTEQRNHPETVEADEAARLVDDMPAKDRQVAIVILRALAGR